MKSVFLKCIFAASLLLFNACIQNNDSEENYALAESLENESGQEMAAELAEMSSVLDFQSYSPALGKYSTSPSSQSPDVRISFQPWSYSNDWWARSGEISVVRNLGEGLLEGKDEVQFKNSSEEIVQFPRIESARFAEAKRYAHLYLEGARGAYWDVSRNWNLKAELKTTNGDSSFVLNGEMVQNIKAENAAKTQMIDLTSNCTVESVVFSKTETGWGRPVSGSIQAESRFKTIQITFENGIATIIVDGTNGNYHAEHELDLNK